MNDHKCFKPGQTLSFAFLLIVITRLRYPDAQVPHPPLTCLDGRPAAPPSKAIAHAPDPHSNPTLPYPTPKALGVKMVLSGEGSDEIFGGYLYFHKAPTKEALHSETVRKLQVR